MDRRRRQMMLSTSAASSSTAEPVVPSASTSASVRQLFKHVSVSTRSVFGTSSVISEISDSIDSAANKHNNTNNNDQHNKRFDTMAMTQSVASFHIRELTLGDKLDASATFEVHEIRAIRQDHKEELPMNQFCRDSLAEQVNMKRVRKGSGWETCNKRFVIKHIRRECMDSQIRFEEAASALENEANMMKSLCHPTIARLRGISLDSTEAYYLTGRHDSYFLILERVEETLKRRIARWRSRDTFYRWRTLHGLLKQKQVEQTFLMERLRVAFDIADGIQYIHDHGVCHRNIRESSFGFNSSNQIQILNFGNACVQKKPNPINRSKGDGIVSSTPHNNSKSAAADLLVAPPSPEIEDRSSQDSGRSTDSLKNRRVSAVENGLKQDILAFTRLLCEILTMRSIGDSMNNREGKAYIRAFRSLASVIPRRLLGMIQRGLSESADSRPTITEFRDCLCEVIFSLGKQTRLSSSSALMDNTSHRRPRRDTQLGFNMESQELTILNAAAVEEEIMNDKGAEASTFDRATETECTRSMGTSLTGDCQIT